MQYYEIAARSNDRVRRAREAGLSLQFPQTLTALLERNARTDAALLFDHATLSYADLLDRSARMAAGLDELGLRPGDRVAIWLTNVPEWLVSFFACARLGLIAVNLNPKFRSKEVGDIVSRSGARALVFDSGAPQASEVLGSCDGLGDLAHAIDVAAQPAALPAELGLAPCRFDELAASEPMRVDRAAPDTACLIYTTSGTTSRPKFALHDQRHLIEHGRQLAEATSTEADSVVAVVVPFCGTYGMSATCSALAAGCTLVVPAVWDVARIAQSFRERRVTHAMAIDDGVEQLLSAAGPECFAAVKCVGIAGMNPRLQAIYDAAEAKGLRLVGMYGSSELQAIVSIQDHRAPLADRLVRGGRLVSPRGAVRAVDPATAETLPHGQPGELQFRTPDSFMREYFLNPEATAAAITRDAFFRTGDLGFTSEDGRFTYLARMGDSMRLGGFLVDPAEIEAVLQSHPDVAEAQVVSVETAAGTRPVAFIIPAAGRAVRDADLLAFTGSRLARFKVPTRFHPVDDFPKTVSANGAKVQKAKLREMAERLERDAAA